MYAALNQNEELINALAAKENEKYICARCSQPVKLVINEKTRYFRHLNKNFNIINEREIHKKGKQIIIKALKELGHQKIRSEYYLPKIKQRPDILIGQNFIVEYQCATISVEKLASRVSSYQQLRLDNLWILGGNYLDVRVQKKHLKFLSYTKKWGFYLLMLDSKNERFRLFYRIKFIGPFNKIVFQRRDFETDEINELINFEPEITYLHDIVINRRQLEQIRRYSDKNTNVLKEQFFEYKKITLEQYLSNYHFTAIKPIYRTKYWQIILGVEKKYLNQPFLDTKKEDE